MKVSIKKRQWQDAWNVFLKLFTKIVRICTFCVSLIFLVSIVIDYGFDLYPQEQQFVDDIYHYVWIYYLVLFSLNLVFSIRTITRRSLFLTIFMGLLMYLSAMAYFIKPSPDVLWMQTLWNFLNAKYYQLFLLLLFSLIEASKGVVRLIGKRTNPAMLLAQLFLIIIFVGTVLLLLPRSTIEGVKLPVIDALFVSTSAVCVTGLTPIDISSIFTMEGQIIIALLIQIGGLGVMTITSFFAMFFMGHTGFYNQFALKDMVNSERMSSLVSTLLNILGFTFIIEGVGALFIWINIHTTMGMTLSEEIFFSVFHSVSAFCNAGFSTLSGNLGNPLLMQGHNGLYLIVSALIFLGGIGFPILVNFKEVLFYHIRRVWHRLFRRKKIVHKYHHLTSLNTRIVLKWSMGLILMGFVLIAGLEWNKAFAGMPVIDKLVHSLFNAIAPRTAGFNSVDLTHFSLLTLILYMFLMWVGGASQSTAGGIKVNTFAVSFSNFLAAIKGEDNLVLFNHEISPDSIRRAYATVFGSLMAIMFFFVALVVLEPDIPALSLLFEVISAMGTVGSSLNVTPLLCGASKVLISVAMFIGRVGLITILISLIPTNTAYRLKYPKGNVIIN